MNYCTSACTLLLLGICSSGPLVNELWIACMQAYNGVIGVIGSCYMQAQIWGGKIVLLIFILISWCIFIAFITMNLFDPRIYIFYFICMQQYIYVFSNSLIIFILRDCILGYHARVARSSALEIASFVEGTMYFIQKIWRHIRAIQICWLSHVAKCCYCGQG